MGLFSFAKDAGSSLFGGKDIDEREIRKHLVSLGLAVNPLSVVANPSTGVVSLIGYARTLADKEKLIVAAGNIKGVKEVDDRVKVGLSPAQQRAQAAEEVAEAASQDAAVEEAGGVDDAEELTAEEAPSAKFYTVQSGDTLGKIAKEMYGNAGKYPVIFEANKPMLTDPDKIYPGQTLRIPPLD